MQSINASSGAPANSSSPVPLQPQNRNVLEMPTGTESLEMPTGTASMEIGSNQASSTNTAQLVNTTVAVSSAPIVSAIAPQNPTSILNTSASPTVATMQMPTGTQALELEVHNGVQSVSGWNFHAQPFVPAQQAAAHAWNLEAPSWEPNAVAAAHQFEYR